MALSFNQRYTEKTARDKRQDIYGRMDDDLEGYIGEIVGTYVEDIGAAKTMELFVEAAEYPEYHDVTPEEEELLRRYGLARILSEVLVYLEGTARYEYIETLELEA
jgi:hypothetical protein